ncbi:hypothetical protein STAN_7091 [Streptomyces sp. CBMAI 2042]|uniref:hypothetical protein n=1 Tax=Streptomyces sp. CBMAI 2042 TaxID=2305222 RepID=UPI000F1E90FA|nr:hypothetical protein [Streptomyces sp. CBMAI 2042]RLV64271.1 hypothetical protein STAN_7091 [Streptomyces sp. CBMAI 2042]
MKRTTAALAVIAASLTGCTTGITEASPEPAQASSASPEYGPDDCLARLDRIYVSGVPRDISDGAECASLTPVEYAGLVGQVLEDHQDESIKKLRNTVPWDVAWDGLDVEMQEATCELLRTEGIYEVGDQLGGGRADEDDVEMALYFLTDRCEA